MSEFTYRLALRIFRGVPVKRITLYINILNVLLISSLYNLVNVDGRGLLPLALPLLFVLLGHRLGSFATLGSSLA